MGRHKNIETPDKMFELFNEYRKEVKENPIYIIEQKKASTNFKIYGNADVSSLKEEIEDASKPIVELPTQRPLTLEGFENFCFEKGVINDLGDYFSNKNNAYSDFSTICIRIRKIIRQDQIEGGMVGIYNPSITQRLNNLVDKQDLTTNGKDMPTTAMTIEIVRPNEEDE